MNMKAKRRVIIVHGWNDTPNNAWMVWLSHELSKRGFEVVAPELPRPRVPSLQAWVNMLAEATGKLDDQTTIIAHSLGTPTALRLIDDYPDDVQLAGLVLVAGFGDGIRERPGVLFSPPLNFGHIAARVRTRVCIYSDNDRIVPPARSKRLAAAIGAREIMVLGGGHFLGQSRLPGSISQFPVALEAVLSCYPPRRLDWLRRLWLPRRVK